MKSRKKGGSIVNISSQSAMIAIPDHATYCASKGALDQLTKVMALELAPFQVRTSGREGGRFLCIIDTSTKKYNFMKNICFPQF